MADKTIIARIDPQPPGGIKYMLGGETWLPVEWRSRRRLHCEEWGNLGPMELDPSIKPNKAGFRVRSTDFPAPPGAEGFALIDEVYYWTAEDEYGRNPHDPTHGDKTSFDPRIADSIPGVHGLLYMREVIDSEIEKQLKILREGINGFARR
jgi:hypothetical protein